MGWHASCVGKGARTLHDHEVDGDGRHEEVVRRVKVKPLPMSRMKVTTRLVVRGRGREPQPLMSAPRLAVTSWKTAAVAGCAHHSNRMQQQRIAQL